MILVITDGVGLTNKIASNRSKADEVLKSFFTSQIEAIDKIACAHCRIVKTTGDGLIIVLKDECRDHCKDHAAGRMLQGIKFARNELIKLGIDLRSVMHYCTDDQVSLGETIVSGDVPPLSNVKLVTERQYTKETLHGDVFGLEVIRVSRIASLIKEDFNIVTAPFLMQLLATDEDDPESLKDIIRSWNRTNSDLAEINPIRIPLPYLKGFEEQDIGSRQKISIKNPYNVWEARL